MNSLIVCKTPEQVLADNELSREQKIKILQRWEYDVRELQVAEEEGMEGPRPITLGVVLRALGAAADTERPAPTKQGTANPIYLDE